MSTGGSNDNVSLRLDLGAGGSQTANRKKMAYVSGSGTDTLVFEYTVQIGDQDPDGVGLQTDLDAVVFLENRAAIRGGNPAGNAAALNRPDLLHWSGSLTIRHIGAGSFGCADLFRIPCSLGLTSDSFTFEGENYQFERISNTFAIEGSDSHQRLYLRLDKAIPAALTLYIDGRQYAVRNASLTDGGKLATWDTTDWEWSDVDIGRRVAVSLIDPRRLQSPHRVDGTLYIDYDTDDDGLIEIATAAQLSALRWDDDGDGAVDTDDQASYALAFPDPVPGMGCPDGDDADTDPDPCRGYEIGTAPSRTALDVDLDVAPYNQGEGWVPIPSYSAILEGNGNTASGLFINKSTNNAGLFHTLAEGGQVRNLGLVDVDITDAQAIGALAANNRGLVVSSYSTGRINGRSACCDLVTVGGLVGWNYGGKIHASYSSASLTLETSTQIINAGGLVGLMERGEIVSSYATGIITLRSGYGGAKKLAAWPAIWAAWQPSPPATPPAASCRKTTTTRPRRRRAAWWAIPTAP